jgi:hypothetical protein
MSPSTIANSDTTPSWRLHHVEAGLRASGPRGGPLRRGLRVRRFVLRFGAVQRGLADVALAEELLLAL